MLESPPHNGTETSRAAAESIKESAPNLRERIHAAIAAVGWPGMTRDEIAQQTGISPNTVRPRVIELINAGRLYVTTHQRRTASGRKAQVIRAVGWV